ncbi:tetratricopeptide repeat protein, partial [Cesiribacter andamanensis]|uniref:tetratricopeptide repeat protein n=1 Tax=Cesiribacter andamanensis TaxID=649507 RepID=UPI00058B1572
MNDLAYWKHWRTPYRILFIMLLVLLAGSILYFIISLLYSPDFVISWLQHPLLEPIQVLLPPLEHPLLPIQLQVDTYVVKQTFWGSPLQVNLTAAAISITFFLIALAVILACLTTLSRLWYFIGITAICGLVVLLRLEQLGVMGRFDNTPMVAVFALLLPLSYFFHALRPQTSFLIRLASFAAVLALLALALGQLATVPYPYLYVVNYGLPAWLGLSALLLILIGPEIIAGILYLITASATPGSRGSLRHFMIASGLFLLNLILYYLEERQYLDLGIYYLGPFWILIISILAGLWTLRMRAEHLRGALVLEPYGLFLYVALACLTLTTLAYAAATANDPLLETFEDAILYSQLGFGFALFLYIIANFYGLLRENQRVYRVLYKPQLMPLFTARLMGLIILVGFVAVRGNWALFQPMAGYYNGLGDLYAVQGDLIVSQNYYRLGGQYQFRNHRSNYALASLAISANQPRPATRYLSEAVERQPTPFAFANLANLHQQQGLFFEALFTLRRGIREFPNAGPLYNNLGLNYGNTQLTDSAFYFLRAAAADGQSEDAALANMMAVLAQRGIRLSPDSLLSWDTRPTLALQNNLLALANRQGYRLRELHPPLEILGSDSSFAAPAYLLNWALQGRPADTLLVTVAQQGFEKARLSPMEEQWGLAHALLRYRLPDHYGAFAAMQDLAERSQFNALTYYKILGQWAMEQGAPRLA